jgi:hypothetical protein
MNLEEIIASMLSAYNSAETAWNQGSTAKDSADESLATLHSAVGGILPGSIADAVAALTEGRERFEEGQAAMTVAQQAIEDYINQAQS